MPHRIAASHPGPHRALKALLDGNQRFAEDAAVRMNQHPGRRDELLAGQEPFAAVLGCSDSRVPVEIAFDHGLGDLFVIRNAGQVVGDSSLASIEFAVAVLHVPLVFVLGHEGCGALAATRAVMAGAPRPPGRIGTLTDRIRPHLEQPGEPIVEPAAAIPDIDQHVRATMLSIAQSSSIVSKTAQRHQLLIAGGVYQLNDGRVRLVSPPTGDIFAQVDAT
ncbi:carbonic anhydrase [Devriesea agamarum]|uniref:carbonic anhydrase n=1 Tax=Devriesea agamarum TaxID=472569 RepID=UPI00071D5A2F|nr:carbonic anhydrase [Devriesea agamarum]